VSITAVTVITLLRSGRLDILLLKCSLAFTRGPPASSTEKVQAVHPALGVLSGHPHSKRQIGGPTTESARSGSRQLAALELPSSRRARRISHRRLLTCHPDCIWTIDDLRRKDRQRHQKAAAEIHSPAGPKPSCLPVQDALHGALTARLLRDELA